MNGFDLIDEPWLPCLFPGAARAQDLSLREVFRRAHEVAELSDRSPLVTAALHRLLLAILHRAFQGPRSEEEWGELWSAGRFDERVQDYLERWRERFDLFHAERPFYQVAGLEEELAAPVHVLSPDFSAGNNPVLFDHTTDDTPPALTPAEAARYLVATQAFAIGGLITRRKGEPASAKASHLVKAAVLLNVGANLFETLMLNLVRYDGKASAPFEFDPQEDAPAWEQEPPRREARRIRGYVDLLTWQSRQLLLFRDSDGFIRRAVRMEGWRFEEYEPIESKETMAAFRLVPGARKDDPGTWVPVGFSPDRALWRDTVRLVDRSSSEESRPPRVLTWLQDLREARELPERFAATTVTAFGMAADRSKVHLWRREALTLPLAYLERPDLVPPLRDGLNLAERVGTLLRNAVRDLAREALAPVDGANPDPGRVSALAESFESLPVYWASLDLPFRDYLLALPEDFRGARAAWAEAIESAARRGFALAEGAVSADAIGFRASARVRPRFEGTLWAVTRDWKPEPVVNS